MCPAFQGCRNFKLKLCISAKICVQHLFVSSTFFFLFHAFKQYIIVGPMQKETARSSKLRILSSFDILVETFGIFFEQNISSTHFLFQFLCDKWRVINAIHQLNSYILSKFIMSQALILNFWLSPFAWDLQLCIVWRWFHQNPKKIKEGGPVT